MTDDIAIIDASALVKLVIPEEHSDIARRIVSSYQRGEMRLLAPDFILTECANVLWRHAIRAGSSTTEAIATLNVLRGRAIALVPQRELVDAALGFAVTYGSSVYDALYCALALREDAALITADSRLVNRVAGSGVRAFTLPDWAARAGW